MVRTRQSIRVLGPADVAAALEVIGTDPVVNVFADYRTRITQLDTRWLGGEMWGYLEDDRLVSTIFPKDDLGLVNFKHIHNAVLREARGKLYIIAQAWNPGDFAVLEQVQP